MPEIAKFAAGLVPGRLDHVRSQLEQYERRDPALVALAAAASLARLIEPELLRALRLGLDSMISGVRLTVATESAVWFSSLVESRGPEAITFLPAALQVLRSRLAAEGELLEQARAIIEKCHRAAPDVLRWEERMIYFSLTGQDRLLEAEVFRGVRSISSGTRLALVNWITDMWVRLPPQARANVQVARLTQAAEGLTFRRLPASTGATMSGNEVTLEFSRIPTREMGMAVRNGRMFFGNLAIADHGIEVPDFNPVEVEILALDGTVLQTVVVPPDGFIGIPVSNDLVRLRTAAGRIYHVNPGALKPRDGYKTVALFRSKRSARLVHRVAVALMEAAYDCQVFASELPRSSFNTQVYKSSDILVVFFDRRNHDEMDLILRDIRLYAMEDKRQPFLLLATIGTEAPLRYRPPGAVVVELGSKSPAQAAAQILASLPLDESEAQTIPNNLPPLDFFIGRETEIEQILRSVGPDSSTWGVMVAGPAGIGKTALAIRAAQDCPPGWFERIIFVNAVEGYLAGLERSVGLAEIENLSALERRERLRHLLRTKRILFIIDDPDFLSIEGLQDLMEFLDQVGPTGCKAIVTTRRPLRSHAVEIVPSGLTSQETRAFLDAITRRDSKLARINESQWTALSEVAHGVPRDLRQLTELLREGGEHSFDEVIRRFYLERERDRSWQSSSRERITDLSEEATTVLCLLAHFVSPVTAADLERVRSIGITGMAKALDTLVQRSLIVRDHTGKVSLVEDVGELLSEWWPQQIKDTGDLLQRYVFSLLVDNGGKQYQRYAVLDEQWVIIDASLSGFFKGPNDRLQAVCYDLNYFLDYTGRWDKSLALSRPAEHKALETNDFLQAGWRATDTGWIHLRRRQAPEVESCAERALAHFRRSQADDRAIGWATRLRAAAREFIDDYSAALAGYRETLKLWSSSPDERGDLAVALNDIARIERSTGNFEAADSHYREALQFATRLQDLERRTETLGNMASLALQRRDWQTARRLASESLAMAEKLGRLELIAFSHQWIAEASLNDSAEAALLHARHAAEIFDRLASPYAERAREIVSEHERRIP